MAKVSLFKDIIYKDNDLIIVQFDNDDIRSITFDFMQDKTGFPEKYHKYFSDVSIWPNTIQWNKVFKKNDFGKFNLTLSYIDVYNNGLPLDIKDLDKIFIGLGQKSGKKTITKIKSLKVIKDLFLSL